MGKLCGLIHIHSREQSSWGQHRAHLCPVGPRWAPCWPHELSGTIWYQLQMYQYAIHARRSGSLHKQFSWERIITAYLGNQWRTPLSSTPEGDLCVGIDTTQALQLRYIPGIYTHDGFSMLCLSLLTHLQLDKWPLFRRNWFQIWFYEWKCFVFGSQFYLSLLLSCYLQSVIPEHTLRIEFVALRVKLLSGEYTFDVNNIGYGNATIWRHETTMDIVFLIGFVWFICFDIGAWLYI